MSEVEHIILNKIEEHIDRIKPPSAKGWRLFVTICLFAILLGIGKILAGVQWVITSASDQHNDSRYVKIEGYKQDIKAVQDGITEITIRLGKSAAVNAETKQRFDYNKAGQPVITN